MVAPLMSATRILIIEDEVLFARAVAKRLEQAGYACTLTTTLGEGVARAAQQPPDLVLLDLRLPDGDGLERLALLMQGRDGHSIPVVVMTAFGEVADAVRAMKLGAADYLKKPIDLEEMVIAVAATLHREGVQKQLSWSREREARTREEVVMLGESPALCALRQQIQQLGKLSGTESAGPTVLIQGETGSGKDVVAHLLHQESANHNAPFIHVDCAALPRDLIEAELFGHERGAYTSALQARTGLLEAAENGTVFLDEIGELPLDLQAKLLTVIERRRVRRVGSVHERPIHARFVAASNRDLRQQVDQGEFRSDLYFRLNVLTLTLPPLRERGADIHLLAHHYARQTAQRYRLTPPRFGDNALEALGRYAWPGNVRELKHLTERAVLLSGGAPLTAAAFALPTQREEAQAVPEGWRGVTLGDAERTLIQQALAESHGNISEAARRLGITRMTLRYRMEKYRIGLETPL
ncbi:MAG: sigma-54-dependent Fis family transcriptional regulator [Ferrovum sp.]|nr:sigma-54-dependent Fis family transcriptional regulator [Ferrovum sp.]